MLERRLGLVVFACALVGLLPGCAHFTSSGRQQLAYAKYVRKQSHNRVKMATKFKKVHIPSANSAEPKITGTSGGPQSVSSSEAPAAKSTQPAQTETTPEPQSE
jgi:hypothetical protein